MTWSIRKLRIHMDSTPDRTDLQILKALQANSRKSYRDMAKELHLSLNTVSARVKRMEEHGIIVRYSTVVDSAQAGFDMTAIIGIQISKGRLMEVQKKIANDRHVSAVYDVTGEWDSIIIARFANRVELNSFIKKMLTTEFIERTQTQVVLNTVKEDYTLPL